MKKILFLMLISGSMLTASAQVTDSTTTTVHKYYYYPSSNVYFDEASGNYWYKDNTSKWSETQTLPATITVEKTPRYSITYNGTEPWKNNTADIKKYKVKKNGTVKMKTKKDADH
ncbi:MAG: hypothetical protein ACTHKY_08170 [Ginsengibacter sp.]|jgi:hypothetical protein